MARKAKSVPLDDARKISEMRNLGPACEKDFNAVGIETAGEIVALGTEDAFVQMLLGRKAVGRSAKCCNATYLYAIYGAIHDIDWRKLPERKKEQFKSFAQQLRDSGQFQ